MSTELGPFAEVFNIDRFKIGLTEPVRILRFQPPATDTTNSQKFV